MSHDVSRPVALAIDAECSLVLEVLVERVVDAGEHFGFGASRDVLVRAAEKRSPCCSEITGVGEYDWNCGV